MWPLAWGGWPSYPSFQLASQAPRVRVSRKRRWYPSAIAPEDESGDCGQPVGDGRCHPTVAANLSPVIADGGTLGVFSY
ncbi:hypothetical protein DES41_108225 [Pseudorhodoferax soli]|uniref:Uncharacterized protein n=1 Tax=Pseudorhodoferax soli TaxID=545864 RepID=A0A368XLY5_9BURK|nr:hypothetical protein DES41_108225 [Pseudorhodoferax soli]